ncbi:unnamed protein product [Rodentolepis nana]|uniref:Uncharacterized protein n=1 Tax=Rodentolepis nana TaxID=102285 RepID=A0A0R3TTA5_RODNA|nr:unnamed protein product [Rodentolepis nana]
MDPVNGELLSDAELSALSLRKRHKIATSTDLVELATAAQNAVDFVNSNSCTKLREIVSQMLSLKDRAVEVLEEATRDAQLHQAMCNMVKRPGCIFYFYRKTDDSGLVASIISPSEWGKTCPYASFFGAFLLQNDQSWIPVERLKNKTNRQMEIASLVDRLRNQPTFLNALTDDNH